MILLPIKPKFAFSIESENKKVEFRKLNFKNRRSDICIVYASSPYKKII
jgi:predicted transcriptional regulator